MEMTDREIVLTLLKHIDSLRKDNNQKNYNKTVLVTSNTIEIENVCYGEDIVFEFDDNERLLSIGS